MCKKKFRGNYARSGCSARPRTNFRYTMTRQLIKYGAAVMTTLLALVVLWQFRIVVIYVGISLMLAATLRPLINRLAGRRFVVRAAWIILYLVALASFGFLLVLTSQNAIKEIQVLA